MLYKEEKGNIEKLVDKQLGVLVVNACAYTRAVFDGLWQDSIDLITALVENSRFQQTWILVDVDSSRRQGLPIECFTETFLL